MNETESIEKDAREAAAREAQERERRALQTSRDKRHYPGLVPGLILVAIGGFLLAREFGYISESIRLLDLWPSLVVICALSALSSSRSFTGAFFSLAFAALGGVLLAGNLGFLTFPVSRLWPALVVLVGVAIMFSGRSKKGPGTGPCGGGGSSWKNSKEGHIHMSSEADSLQKQITMAGAEIKIDSTAWKGGHLGVTVGGVELDLRYASLASEGATLHVSVLMGGIDLRVPPSWQVTCDVTPMLGGVDDVSQSPQGLPDSPRLRIVGSVVLGGVTVRN